MFGGPYRSNEFENEPRGTAAKNAPLACGCISSGESHVGQR